ncbi:hypothetical protein ACOQFO_01275 [Ureibacillus sp. MALMAid1270]|uniref:hypothetical protein n=1 Tax=Ureibacillus sp. MALMAid1270 TaxID=3411629 RepID=UPI003BA5B349
MKNFIRLIFVSIIYALFFVLETELMLNVYRISRLINIGVETVSILITILVILLVILSTFIFYVLNLNFLKQTKWNYLGSFICLPFISLFIFLFTIIFPMHNEGDRPVPIMGLFFATSVILYPFYLLIIIAISSKNRENV